MTKTSYKQMLIESLIDISSMSSYKGPAEKVLDAKDEKFETFRSATSEVDVLGRAYAGQDDWDNKFITENSDMDEENVAQGEPSVKVKLPDGHDPDVTDLEDNIDESDPDKLYQEPITGEQDAKSKLNVEGAEDPVSLDTTEDDEDEDEEDDGTITEPSPGLPTQDEFQNSDPEIATEGDEDLGEDLPEDEPIEDDEPADDFSDEDDIPEDDEDLGEDLPEDEPIEETVEDGEVITGDQPPVLGDDLPEDEPPAGDFPEEHLDEGDEDLGEDLPEDEPIEDEEPVDDEQLPTPEEEDEGVPEDEDLGEDLPEDEPVDDDSDFQTEDDSTEQEIDDEFEDSEDVPDEDDVITDEPSDIDSAADEEDPSLQKEALTEEKTSLVGDMARGGVTGAALSFTPAGTVLNSVAPGLGALATTTGGMAAGAVGHMVKRATGMNEGVMYEDMAMDPNANLGAPPPAAPAAPMPPATPAGDPTAGAVPPPPPAGDPNAAPPMDPTMDPNAAAGVPADPNAPVDPNDPNAQPPEGGGEVPEQQDPILDVDSNVVASDTSTPQDDNQQPVPTQESVMESLITELGSYMDSSNADMKDLLSQDVDD